MSGAGFGNFHFSGQGEVHNPVESDEGTEADEGSEAEDEQPDAGEEQ